MPDTSPSIYAAGTRQLFVNRWNGGRLRRYHLPNGAVVVVGANRSCTLLPAFCHHISQPVSRDGCAKALRTARAKLRAA